MRPIWETWKKALKFFWENLVTLIVVNVLWVLTALPLVTVGAGTFAAYWWVAHVLRDGHDREGLGQLLRAFRRFFWRGLIWSVAWALVLWLAVVGLTVWPRLLSPLGGAVVRVAWFYILIFLGALQPYLLEALTVEERPWGEALKRSAWHVVANPIYSHAQLLVPVTALGIGARFATFIPLVLISLIIAFLTVAAAEAPWKYGAPRPVSRRDEDVL